jgi:predicted translin family RNA/ssDNA-binding protein
MISRKSAKIYKHYSKIEKFLQKLKKCIKTDRNWKIYRSQASEQEFVEIGSILTHVKPE